MGLGPYAARAPEAAAVVAPDGRTWSRVALDGFANRLAQAFLAAGIAPGASLAIVSPNCAEYLAAYFAGIRAGLRVVPVNWHLAPDELDFVLRDCAPRAVLVHARLGAAVLDAVRAALERDALCVSIGSAPGFVASTALAAAQRDARPHVDEPGRVMSYTSATTGRPKAVVLPARNAAVALARVVAWHRSFGIEPEDGHVHLCASMLYHSAPLEGAVTALRMGHCVVLADRWRAQALLELIDRHRVTTAFMVPAMFVRLLGLEPEVRARCSVRSLRFVIHTGAPCPPEIKRRMLDWWGPIVWEVYGAAEGQGTIASAREWLERPGTVGRPIPGSAVQIRDAHGRDCAAGVVGRVYLKPHTGDLPVYKDDPEKTRAAIDGDFVTVGDLGYLDADGYLYLCDRESELILCSGMNVYPAEIEAALITHPAVADCGVVGVTDAVFGQVPVAYVELAEGYSGGAATTLALLEHLRARLAAMKLPRRVFYVARLPRDPSGKLRRRELATAHPAASRPSSTC